MSEDVAGRLRELARDHSEERLSLMAYRGLRAPLIDSLSAHRSAADDPEVITRPRAEVLRITNGTQTSRPHRAAEPDPSPGPGAQPQRSHLRRTLPLGAIILVAGVLGLGAWLMWGKRPGGMTSVPAISTHAPVASPKSDPLRNEIEPLLDSDDWSPDRLVKVNAALLEAGPQRIQAAAGAEWFQRLADAVRQRLKEQRALGSRPLTPDKSPLAALAVTIGIDLMPPAAIPITPAERQPPVQRVAATSESQRPQPAPAQGVDVAAHASQPPPVPGNAASPRGTPAPTATAAGTAAAASPASSSTPDRERGASQQAASTMTGVTPSAAPSPAFGGTTAPAQAEGCRGRYCQDPLTTGEPGIRFAIVSAGTYQMGNADAPSERPAHTVTIRQSFAISVEEISQAEFRWSCGKTRRPCPAQPSSSGDDYPVVNVSWNDATEYARWLSQMTGRHYRLPTEAEWEYSARAGRTGLFPRGDSLNPVDAYFSDTAKLTAPAPRRRNGEFNANPWRLYHMVGNVREWVQDTWEPNFDGAPNDGSAREKIGAVQKVVRGGSFADGRANLRLTTREGLGADTRDSFTGIRMVREIP